MAPGNAAAFFYAFVKQENQSLGTKHKYIPPSVHDAMEEVVSEKGLTADTVAHAVEEAVSEAFRRHYQTEMEVKTKLETNGRFTIFGAKTVVETVADPLTEIAQSDPVASRYGLGDAVWVEITTSTIAGSDKLTDGFGRVAALLAKQIIKQRIREAERRLVFEEYKGREGEMVHGKIQRIRHGNFVVELGRIEAILPRRELPPREKYKENDRIKAVIIEVRLGPKGPQIVLSRAHPWLVQRLFEMEISEVFDKTVEIKSIAREPGFRTKVAVSSRDSAVDPVGACVGQKGIRVQTVVKELGGEKIDIVHWDPEPTVFIRNALSPAECDRVIIHEDTRVAEVIVPEDHLSLAIGKEGQNARLAAKLTNWKIDIRGAGESAKEEVEELIRMTFGSTPAEILASIGVGAETAPVLETAGFIDVESLATASVETLAALIGPDAAAAVSANATAKWQDLQQKLSETAAERNARKKKRIKRAPVEVLPFVLSGETAVKDLTQLTEALDALPADEVQALLQSDSLKKWLQDLGLTPAAIADLMARYK